jgi:hypothetical protein
MTKTPEYSIWQAMKDRCRNPNNPYYASYGGRGITVCDEWANSFEAWYRDVGPRPASEGEGKSQWWIERVDNSKGYFPGNVVWADVKTQNRNKRLNVMVEFRGETKCVTEWAEIVGIHANDLRYRLKHWTIEEALTMKPFEKALPNERRLTYNGETKSISAWGKTCGITRKAIEYRLKKGMTVEEALTTPAVPGIGLKSKKRESA